MSQREYLNWRLYWAEEPWGSLRDNLHAAMIAREVIRPHVKAGVKVEIEDFMVKRRDEGKSKRQAAVARLALVAKKVAS